MRAAVLSLLSLAVLAAPVAAQQKRVSPHEQASVTIGGKKITIEYGRPYMKGRRIFGGVVPLGQVWRTGADEATKLTTEAALTIGSLKVPAGTYALFTLPTESGWTLIVNKTAEQWGAFTYDQKQDLGRTPMKVEKAAAPAEQFTISLEAKGAKGGVLKTAWDTTVATAEFSVN